MRESILLSIVLVASVGGCASPTSPGDDILEGKLSNNGLVLSIDNLNHLSTQALATRSGGQTLVNEEAFGALLAASGGSDLMGYLAICALDEGESMTVMSTGQQFAGNLGLAPEWVDGRCDQSCQRWMTACILAHTNANGSSVEISPRGSNPGLSWGGLIATEFSYLEAAYYGNMFKPANERVLSACLGQNIEDPVNEGAVLAGRICGIGACEFTFTGYCDDPSLDAVSIAEPVCNGFSESFYFSCSTDIGASVPSYSSAERFSEVITVYVP